METTPAFFNVLNDSHDNIDILKQDQAASQLLKEEFNPSDGEEKFIVNAKMARNPSYGGGTHTFL